VIVASVPAMLGQKMSKAELFSPLTAVVVIVTLLAPVVVVDGAPLTDPNSTWRIIREGGLCVP